VLYEINRGKTASTTQIIEAGTSRIHKSEDKVRPRTGHQGPEVEWRNSSTLSLASALDGVGGQRHAPAALPPGKTRYPLYRRVGGPQGQSGGVR
jgi:hypothetical protein